MKKKDILFVLLILIFVMLKIPTLNLPFYQDEMSFIYYTFNLSHHINLNTVTHYSYVGHPPLLQFILIAFMEIFPWSLVLPHLISLSFALIALYFFYKIIEFYSKKDALILTILLALTPVFFTQAGLLNTDMPVCAFILGSYYFYIQRRMVLFTVFSSFAVLIKEPALIEYAILLSYYLFRNKEKLILILKKQFYLIIPPLLYFIWIMIYKIKIGTFFWPPLNKFVYPSLNALSFTFLANLRFLILPFVIISILKKKKDAFLLFSLVLGPLYLFSFIFLKRYILILVPFLYVLVSQIKSKSKYFVVAILIIFSPFMIFPPDKHILPWEDYNMNYVKLIKLHKSGYQFIDTHLNASEILSIWPHDMEISSTKFGYVKKNYTAMLPSSGNLPRYAYASSLQGVFETPSYEELLRRNYTLIFSNYSYGNYVKVYQKR